MKQSICAWIANGLVLCSLATTGSTQAQIVPDATLPQNSNVTLEGNTSVITGGTVAGSNLFHSFKQFTIPTGSAAYFNNVLEIQNIVSRVTGSSISNIDGLIQANGTANLFLLNPNGMILGPNASLNIGGSFLASTASSLKFADNTQFSAAAPQTTPLLTVSVPIGLQFGGTAGSIANQSPVISSNGTDLRVQPGRTLALIGGDVRLDSTTLRASDGRIELGGVSGAGVVGLNVESNNLSLSFPNDIARADVSLANGTLVDASGEFGGDIQVQGRQITLTDGSQIVIETLGSETEGALTINASESVKLTEESGLFTGAIGAAGTGSDITITTEQLSVQDSEISTNTFLTSKGPRISRGEAGDLVIIATELVELIGTSADGQVPSGLFTQASGENDAGDLTIATGQLIIQDGAQVGASALGEGSGGTLTITASESVELVGTSNDGQLLSSLSTQAMGSGDAGDLTIATGQLIVRDKAQVAVSSQGSGDAGNIDVEANSIQLYNQAALTAQSKVAEGGNITLQVQNLLLLRDNSLISTKAGGTGNDGNITIDANVILAVPSENSDIVAAAVEGKGGNVQVRAKGIFGPQFPEQLTTQSDIVATGQVDIEGTVTEVRTPETLSAEIVDATQSVVQSCRRGGDLGRGTSEFTITGRGGLPPTPGEVLRGEVPLVDLGLPIQGQAKRVKAVTSVNSIRSKPIVPVEAQGWKVGSNGEVVLTAQAHTATPHSPWLTTADCPASSASSS
jgi:filamentous hemagglutinin family protein